MDAVINTFELQSLAARFPPPTIVDVRRSAAYKSDPHLIAGAIWRDPEKVAEWATELDPWRPVVVYCVHGHDVSQGAAAALASRGFAARYLAGGLEAWRAANGATQPARAQTRWVTRERPKIDRIACPWLIRRFIDPDALFAYVPAAQVRAYAAEHAMTPYDIPDVEFSHVGAECSFDAFVHTFKLEGTGYAALAALATIVRGADTGEFGLAQQSPGLVAISLGLSRTFSDDHAMLRWGMLCYDALFAWCRDAQGETHHWRPELLP